MNDDSELLKSSEGSHSGSCSRSEAMELAIRTAVIAHLFVCLISLALCEVWLDQGGILMGLGIAAVLAGAIPFLVLPTAAAIGYFSHLAFHRSRLPIPLLVGTLVILFEATLLGWMVVLAIQFAFEIK